MAHGAATDKRSHMITESPDQGGQRGVAVGLPAGSEQGLPLEDDVAANVRLPRLEPNRPYDLQGSRGVTAGKLLWNTAVNVSLSAWWSSRRALSSLEALFLARARPWALPSPVAGWRGPR